MTKVCVDDLTVGQVKELTRFAGTTPSAEHPYVLGKNYFIRCVTHYYTGRLVRVTAQELVLEDAAWIADTGRFAQAMETGDFSEIEPYPAQELIIGRGAVVDAIQGSWTLPKKQK